MIRNRYEPAYLTPDPQGKKGPKPFSSGKWTEIAANMPTPGQMQVADRKEAYMLYRALAKRGIAAKVQSRQGEPVWVIVP